jgi:hypothetical protein
MSSMTRDDEQPMADELLAALRAGADFRERKVRKLRAAIRASAYENHLKLDIACDRLISELLEMERTAEAPRKRGG